MSPPPSPLPPPPPPLPPSALPSLPLRIIILIDVTVLMSGNAVGGPIGEPTTLDLVRVTNGSSAGTNQPPNGVGGHGMQMAGGGGGGGGGYQAGRGMAQQNSFRPGQLSWCTHVHANHLVYKQFLLGHAHYRSTLPQRNFTPLSLSLSPSLWWFCLQWEPVQQCGPAQSPRRCGRGQRGWGYGYWRRRGRVPLPAQHLPHQQSESLSEQVDHPSACGL